MGRSEVVVISDHKQQMVSLVGTSAYTFDTQGGQIVTYTQDKTTDYGA